MLPLPSPAKANFAIMMGCTAEIGNCRSVSTVLCDVNYPECRYPLTSGYKEEDDPQQAHDERGPVQQKVSPGRICKK